MRKNTIIILLILFLFAAGNVCAENTFDFLRIAETIYRHNDNIWGDKIDTVQKYAYSLKGFTCQKSESKSELFPKSIDIVCRSRQDSFSGKYVITYSFDSRTYLRSIEIQAWNPGLDNYLNKTMYGIEDFARITQNEAEKLTFMNITKESLGERLVHGFLFIDKDVIIKHCKEINGDTIFCTGYKNKTKPSEKETIVVSMTNAKSIK